MSYFEGFQTHNRPFVQSKDTSIMHHWQLHQRIWYMSSSDEDDNEDSDEHTDDTQSILPRRRSRKLRSTPSVIERLPRWAWDITGEWSVKCPVLKSMLKLPKASHLHLVIRLANIPRHSKIGRQLWATFMFGKYHGVMRFCPVPDFEESIPPSTLQLFERGCVLDAGEWPGSSPKGKEKWLLRYRGDIGSDCSQSPVEFSTGPDGKLRMRGLIFHESTPAAFTAVKISDRVVDTPNSTSVSFWWDLYKH